MIDILFLSPIVKRLLQENLDKMTIKKVVSLWLDVGAVLPEFSLADLEQIVVAVDNLAPREPKRGVAMMWAVVVLPMGGDVLLQAQTNFYLGKAYNAWGRPHLSMPVLARAEAMFSKNGWLDWVAACEWQQHVLGWARGSYSEVEVGLDGALVGLKNAGKKPFTHFYWQCLLERAYLSIITTRFKHAHSLLEQIVEHYGTTQNEYGLAQTEYYYAGMYRRQGLPEQASQATVNALRYFDHNQLQVEIAKSIMVQGTIAHYGYMEMQEAIVKYEKALDTFQQLEMPIWEVSTMLGLTGVYKRNGQSEIALSYYEKMEAMLLEYGAFSLYTEVLINYSNLYSTRGQYQKSLALLANAETYFSQKTDSPILANAYLHRGITFQRMGNYERALSEFEQIEGLLEKEGSPRQIIQLFNYLATNWLHLNHPQNAHACLDKCETLLNGDAPTFAKNSTIVRARILLVEGRLEEAIKVLRAARHEEGIEDDYFWADVAQLIGVALYRKGDYNAALIPFVRGRRSFERLQAVAGVAESWLWLGRCHVAMGEVALAKQAWQEVLNLGEEIVPAFSWQAYGELAQIAEKLAMKDEAFGFYWEAVQVLSKMRRGFWQPEMAGSFGTQFSPMLDAAVSLAAALDKKREALQIIEESKAQTQANRLGDDYWKGEMPAKLDALRIEIEQLRDKIKRDVDKKLFSTHVDQKELLQKIKNYNDTLLKQERVQFKKNPSSTQFDLAQFQAVANEKLGKKWIAVDYYLTEENTLFCVVLTPQTYEIIYCRNDRLADFALNNCLGVKEDGSGLSHTDLIDLGEWLFPQSIRDQLNAGKILIIVPHKTLHRLPWAALSWLDSPEPLVMTAIPLIVPSLQIATLLWQRQHALPKTDKKGLLLAISKFKTYQKPLEKAVEEGKAIKKIIDCHLDLLFDERATSTKLRQMAQDGRLATYDFLHIASHAFTNSETGHLNGIAFYDVDMWLGELKDLAPLPPLIMLSTCSSTYSKIHFGDELIGLPNACLLAGAERVIGCLWALMDGEAEELMKTFYTEWCADHSAPLALAKAQRQAWKNGIERKHWAGFILFGI